MLCGAWVFMILLTFIYVYCLFMENPIVCGNSFPPEGQISHFLRLFLCLQSCFNKGQPCASSCPVNPPKSCLSPCDGDSLHPNPFLSHLSLLPFSFTDFSPHYFCQAASMWLTLSLASSLCLSLPSSCVLTSSRCSQKEGPQSPTLPPALTPSPLTPKL